VKNYRDSDYAVNKFSKGIVYRFDDETIEITLEDYLRENPDKTEEDFLRLKAISDEIFLEEIRLETAQAESWYPLTIWKTTLPVLYRLLMSNTYSKRKKNRTSVKWTSCFVLQA